MTWTLIIIVLWGNMPTTQVVAPFQSEKDCAAAAKRVTDDFRKATQGFYFLIAPCVSQ